MIFRFPGGKGKIGKKFINHIRCMKNGFADVFVGGGSIALAISKRDKTTRIYLNDLDPWVANFWTVVVGDDASFGELISKIESVGKKPTLDQFKKLREKFLPQDFLARSKASIIEGAFCLLYFNRTTFSGILSSGPIGGEDQEHAEWAIDARWTPIRLVEEIKEARNLLQGRTEVTNLDFTKAIERVPFDCFMYLDPPYYNKGSKLYGPVFTKDNHQQLFETLRHRDNWLLSYDNRPEIKELYKDYKWETLGKTYRSMSSQSDRPEDESELIIFSKEKKMKEEKEKHCKKQGCSNVFTNSDLRTKYCEDHRTGRKTVSVPVVKVNDKVVSISGFSKGPFKFLTVEQKDSLLYSHKCEIDLDQVREASK